MWSKGVYTCGVRVCVHMWRRVCVHMWSKGVYTCGVRVCTHVE